MAEIDLAHLLDINPDQLDKYIFYPAVYKKGFCPKGGAGNPLTYFAKGREKAGEKNTAWWNWLAWYYGDKNEWKNGWKTWNCDYILSFIQLVSEGRKDMWLFGGIFENKGLTIPRGEEKKQDTFYDIDLTDQGQEYIGRLKIIYAGHHRRQYAQLDWVYDELKVSDIAKPHAYSDPSFVRYEDVSLNFTDLEFIFEHNKDDWRSALYHIKGIYVIFDKKTNQKYVGSAYGPDGVWKRWNEYKHTVHGDNKKLKKLFEDKSDLEKLQYARENFSFTLLEWFPPNQTTDEYIKEREKRWKEILLSRGDFGYNAN